MFPEKFYNTPIINLLITANQSKQFILNGKYVYCMFQYLHLKAQDVFIEFNNISGYSPKLKKPFAIFF